MIENDECKILTISCLETLLVLLDECELRVSTLRRLGHPLTRPSRQQAGLTSSLGLVTARDSLRTRLLATLSTS